MTYIDKFDINGTSYHVADDFSVWKNGCKIADRANRAVARETIQSYAVSQLTAELAGMKDRVRRAELTLCRLDTGDVFDLAQFRVVPS